ncbi:MAG: DUF2075 domain-containing protein [Planctomycetes bacterium]|nr:DUF2075 domain-containing protein [Planctomycetota bacterium]
MDLWRGPLPRFVELARSGSIAADMMREFYTRHGFAPSASEIRSWENSLAALGDALLDSPLKRAAVALRGSGPATAGPAAVAEGRGETALATEYHLPLDGRRIDVLFLGHDTAARPHALALELKQWSACDVRDEFDLNLLVDDREHPHPSRQSLDYAGWLVDYHSAFTTGGVAASAASWCHNMDAARAGPLRGPAFAGLLEEAPLFLRGEGPQLSAYLAERVGTGDGLAVLDRVAGGKFHPSPRVLDVLEEVIRSRREWHLLGEQRTAYNAILAEVRRRQRSRGRSAILVRGGPGTGKTVIAIQLLVDALRLGLAAAHSTGGKAFTTALRSKFRGADKLFRWNMNMAGAPTGGLDLLLVDEAHRVRTTSNMRFTARARRSTKSQIEELLDAAKVCVFFLDENQFVRPDEIGSTQLVVEATGRHAVPLRSFDLAEQFRCGGCRPYVDWVDWLLGFSAVRPPPWGGQYTLELANDPGELDALMADAARRSERARLLAGFCWTWSKLLPGGGLVDDVRIGAWSRPWNAQRDPKKTYRPDNDPYTLWAESSAGLGQVGCIYSAQGFEFEQVGVIWGPDLVWRRDHWVAVKEASHDPKVRPSSDMLRLVRNAYRVLITRGIRGTRLLVLDEETQAHVRECLEGMQTPLPSTR